MNGVPDQLRRLGDHSKQGGTRSSCEAEARPPESADLGAARSTPSPSLASRLLPWYWRAMYAELRWRPTWNFFGYTNTGNSVFSPEKLNVKLSVEET